MSFYLLRYESGEIDDISEDMRVEVVRAFWIPLADAPKLLAYKGEKQMARQALEYLETRGVPVIGYRTSDFPAFWSRSSHLPVPLRLDSLSEISRMLDLKWSLGLEGGALVANPVDAEDEIPSDEMSDFIETAIAEASSRRITGKAVTPFLLSRLVELSNGRSLRTNIALVKSNARVGGELAASWPA